MSSSHDDWRAEAARRMATVEGPPPQPPDQSASMGLLLVKLGLLVLLSLVMVWLGGFGWLAAVAIVAWFLFWPR